MFDDAPARSQEFCRESIRTWRLSGRELLHGVPDLIQAKRQVKVIEVTWLNQLRQVKSMFTALISAQ
jgi:hypothetical protein